MVVGIISKGVDIMMKASAIIEECMKEKHLKQKDVARYMGENPRELNQRLRRLKDIKVGTFSDILAAMGFRLTVIDIGIKKVVKSFGVQIEEYDIKGVFYYVDEVGSFIAIANIDEKLEKRVFLNEEDCIEWLELFLQPTHLLN